MKLYGIPNCSTVKKARQWLDGHKISYTFHDFKKQGIDEQTIKAWLSQYSWETLVNRSGMTWRQLDESEKLAICDALSATQLMLQKTSVIKRPVLENQGKILALGFKDTDYQSIFNR
jgi:arsenate reductase (glutaredoxin)